MFGIYPSVNEVHILLLVDGISAYSVLQLDVLIITVPSVISRNVYLSTTFM